MIKDLLINKIKNVLFLGLIFVVFSCIDNSKKISKSEILVFLKKQNYWNEEPKIYKLMNDSISLWHKLKVEGYNYDSTVKIKIDSFLCLNKLRDKILTVKYNQINEVHSFDGYTFFYGVKVNDVWYFFDGPYQPVSRLNPKIPATFHQLSQIAFDDVFQYYLKKNDKGELEINEGFFSDLTSGSWAEGDEGIMPKTKLEWDQRYIRAAAKNRSKIDTTDYTEMK